MSSQNNMGNIDKKNDERDQIDMVYDKNMTKYIRQDKDNQMKYIQNNQKLMKYIIQKMQQH